MKTDNQRMLNQVRQVNNNILIARFMGAYPHDSKDLEGMWFNDAKFPHGFTNVIGESFKYNTEWNWLMPVVEKIEELGYDFNILTPNVIEVLDENAKSLFYLSSEKEGKKEAVYNACIDFIKWYNENSAGIKN